MIGFIKQDFVKKGGLTKTFLIKRGVGAKGGGLEQFRILRGVGGGGVGQKEWGDFFREGGGEDSYPGAHYGNLSIIFSTIDL